MKRISVCYLVSETYEQDSYGVISAHEEKTKVYCDVTSVSQKEWFEGGRNGLNPEYKMTMFKYDYSGEQILEYNEVQYTIYRTYEKGDLIELYVQKRKGNEEIVIPDDPVQPADPSPEENEQEG